MLIYLKSLFFYFKLKIGKLNSKEIEFFILDIFLKKKDNFIDVGSNIGRYSFEASKIVGNKGKVYSFEPLKEIFIIQTLLIKMTGLQNIINFNLALSNQTRLINFKVIPTNSQKFFLFNTLTQSKISKLGTVNNYSFTLDKFNFKKIKLIKIDCEGEEINILKGSINTIKKSQPVLIIEENKDKNKIIKYLKNYGYFFIKISNSRNIIFLKKNEYNSIIKKLSLLNINIDSMLKN